MSEKYLNLYLEIKSSNFIFYVQENDDENNFKIKYKLDIPAIGLEDNKIIDFDNFFETIKKNIYLAEQSQKCTFKEVVLILDNFNTTFVNLSGYKKLNGSQILRENITYILNMLKFDIDKIESKKTILHIFNSRFLLDNKKIENPPIGLFGDFFSHELCFALIEKNDFKNLQNLFEKCNLRIKKILLKSYVKGVFISNRNENLDTFYFVEIDTTNSKIFYFENNCLKFEQSFKFGYNIIFKDIAKITLLKRETIEKILNKTELNNSLSEEELIEKEFFEENEYKKIKKKLIFQIVEARVSEILEIMIFNNVNLKYYNNLPKTLFFQLNSAFDFQSIKEVYKTVLLQKGIVDIRYSDELSHNSTVKTASKLVHFGWKRKQFLSQTKKINNC